MTAEPASLTFEPIAADVAALGGALAPAFLGEASLARQVLERWCGQ